MKKYVLLFAILLGIVTSNLSFALPTIEEECEGGREISLDYTIKGKDIVKICDDISTGSLFFGLEGTSEGTMQVKLPFFGNHTNTAHFACAFEYFFLDNGEEVLASFEETDYGKRITVDFNNNTKVIQIIAPSYLNEGSWKKIWSCEKKFSQDLPPMKQIFAGISNENIYCNEDYVLIFKSTDNSPACVKPESIPKLIERGWAKEVLVPTFEYVIIKDTVTYGSSYQIVGGLVDEIHYNKDSNSLIISLSESGNGYLQILIQNGVLHPHRESSFNYFVLIDGEEVIFEKLSPILLKIPFEKGTKLIEIIGTNPT